MEGGGGGDEWGDFREISYLYGHRGAVFDLPKNPPPRLIIRTRRRPLLNPSIMLHHRARKLAPQARGPPPCGALCEPRGLLRAGVLAVGGGEAAVEPEVGEGGVCGALGVGALRGARERGGRRESGQMEKSGGEESAWPEQGREVEGHKHNGGTAKGHAKGRAGRTGDEPT